MLYKIHPFLHNSSIFPSLLFTVLLILLQTIAIPAFVLTVEDLASANWQKDPTGGAVGLVVRIAPGQILQGFGLTYPFDPYVWSFWPSATRAPGAFFIESGKSILRG